VALRQHVPRVPLTGSPLYVTRHGVSHKEVSSVWVITLVTWNVGTMTKVMHILDVQALIDAVRDRPALWDTRCSEYSDKVKKAQCWREILFYI
jgi:hypothetical protein